MVVICKWMTKIGKLTVIGQVLHFEPTVAELVGQSSLGMWVARSMCMFLWAEADLQNRFGGLEMSVFLKFFHYSPIYA